ncbi:MAG: Fe2+-dependent dioxygenase [Alphaproteobacteria bacterium]|nr:Fe2+-dependent dioxygenase [Alphaproteobacteria bacterium]
MQIVIGAVLSADEIALMRETLAQARFEDGRATAGFAARLVKNNEQATADRRIETIRKLAEERILASALFDMAVRPKALTAVMFSRYESGMQYGSHVDDALMQGTRTDVSFTLFLSEPDSYDGGELVIESASGEDAIKLAAGSLVAYPSTTLHHVAPITRGVRLAAVGWARSYVRDAAQREMLFDLDTARRALFAREGKSTEYDLVAKSLANLMRMWVED